MKLVHYADILAIPFFLLLTLYFYKKVDRTDMENILFLFAISGFVLDTYFSCQFLTNKYG